MIDVTPPTTPGLHTVVLTDGQRTWHPGSTKHMLYGPMILDWRVYADGGVSSRITARGDDARRVITDLRTSADLADRGDA